MAALADYLDLRLAVADHVGRHDLSDLMPRFVQSAEAWLNKKLRTNDQITEDTVTFTDGVASLPADFAEMIHVYTPDGFQMRATSIANIRRSYSVYGRYAIRGDTILIHGISGDRSIVYYATLPTLTASPTTTNWLLAKCPDLYLYAVGMEAAKHVKDADLVTATRALLEGEMSALRGDDYSARWSNATVRMQGVTP